MSVWEGPRCPFLDSKQPEHQLRGARNSPLPKARAGHSSAGEMLSSSSAGESRGCAPLHRALPSTGQVPGSAQTQAPAVL